MIDYLSLLLVLSDYSNLQHFPKLYLNIRVYLSPSVVRACLWTQGSRVQTRPRTMDFKGDKIRSTPSFGGEVKPSFHVVDLWHAK
jgi:hypothetical protein